MNNRKLVAYTILGNVGIAVLAFIAITHFIWTGKHLLMIGILVSAWFVMDYIKELQKQASVDRKMIRLGYIVYTITALIGFVILILRTDMLAG